VNRHVRVARNIVALLINQLGTWSITLVLTFVVPPYLGAKTYGLYGFVLFYAGFFALLMGMGTATYLTWRIAREPEQAPRLTFNTLVMQIPLCLLCGALALLLLPLLDGEPLVMMAALGVIVSTMFGTLSGTCAAALGGFQNMRTPAFIGLGMSALSAGLVVVAVQRNLGLLALIAAGLISQVIGTTVMLAYTQRRIHLRPQLDFRLWPKIILGGLPFFGWSAILVLYSQVNIPLLKALSGDTVVGWYTIANRITGIPVFLPSIVITAILPALAHERTAESLAFRALASRGLRLVTAVGIPACVGTLLLAPTVIHLLHYPASFNPAVPVIVILAFNMPVVALDMVMGTVLIALGRQKAWMVVGLVAGVVTSLLNLWLIPYTQHLYGNGAIGAALTTLLSEVIMFGGAMYLRPRSIFTGGDVWYMVRCLLAAVVMLPAVGLGSEGGSHLYRSVAYGMFVYALAAYAFQIVTNDDLKGLVLVVSNRLGIETLGDLRSVSLGALLRMRGGAGNRMARAGAVISQPLARTGAVISQPLALARAAVSHPLAQARAAVSQLLAHAGERLGAAANRYWPHDDTAATADQGSASYDELGATAPLPSRQLSRSVAMAGQSRHDQAADFAATELDDGNEPTKPRHPRMLAGAGSAGAIPRDAPGNYRADGSGVAGWRIPED
jgi:O-antigen/teichoic acid export membrane protein